MPSSHFARFDRVANPNLRATATAISRGGTTYNQPARSAGSITTGDAMIEVGSRIRDYEIIAPLKAGGMASLFLARRAGAAGFARTVAIKVVHAHLAADRDFVTMFVDEAKLSSRISHPNVV